MTSLDYTRKEIGRASYRTFLLGQKAMLSDGLRSKHGTRRKTSFDKSRHISSERITIEYSQLLHRITEDHFLISSCIVILHLCFAANIVLSSDSKGKSKEKSRSLMLGRGVG